MKRRVVGKIQQRPPATPQSSGLRLPHHSGVASCVPPPSHNYSTTTSLKDLIKWPVAYAHLAADRLPDHDSPADVTNTIAHAVTQLETFSSSFSGVCAEKVAMNCMRAGLEHLYAGSEFPKLRYLSAIDHDTECQHECKLVPGSAGCIYKSMETLCSDTLLRELDNECEPYDADRLFELCMRPGAIRLDGECVVHGKRCVHPRASAHSGSIPCTDWTTWGSCRRLTGATAIPTIIFLVLRIILLEGWVMIENVVPFDPEFLQRYTGKFFDMLTSTGCNTDFGIPPRRPRRFTLLLLRGMWSLCRPLQDFTTLFARQRRDDLTWRCFLCASDPELRTELAASRPGITNKPHVVSGRPTGAHFKQTLLSSEHGRLQGFLDDHNCHDCVVALGQDPSFTRTASQPHVLHTLVRNNHIQFVPELDRWFSMRELFLWQLFPVTNQSLEWSWEDSGRFHTSGPPPLTSLNRSRLAVCLPPRSRTEAGHQAGNSICISTAGAFLMFLFLHLERASVSIPASLVPSKRGNAPAASSDDVQAPDDPKCVWLAARKRRKSRAGAPDTVSVHMSGISGSNQWNTLLVCVLSIAT